MALKRRQSRPANGAPRGLAFNIGESGPTDLRRPKPEFLALARLEATLHLVDHVDATLAAHETIVAIAATQRFQ
jgi:hypothetical protein